MNFESRFKKVKQQADRLFLRGDRTDVVGELRYAEENAEELRVLCEAFYRSIEKRLNTHSVTEEKKHRKVPENQVAETLKDALKEVSQNQGEDVQEKALFKTTIEEIVAVEQLLGKEVLDHEEQVIAEVLQPLHKLLKEDFPSVAKQKKALKQAGQDVDAAKAKVRNMHSNIAQPNKVDAYKEELDEAENKLEQIKDSYAADLFAVLGRQREITRLSNLYLEMKADHLQKSLQRLNTVLPPVRKILDESTCSPMYGIPLYEHLRVTQQEIAVPIQICAKRMIEFGLYEEGLLRMAGSSTKIKRLKSLFDAGLISVDTTLEDYNRDYDVHVIAGAFKSYLRELPEPLLTHTKHDELIEAVRKPEHKEKLRHMWQVINALPMQNYNNLRYVIKFLALLASHSNENKMTPNNIAIVMAHNLIGSQKENDSEILAMGRNMTLGTDYRVIVEQLIEYADYFFKGEVVFGVQPRRLEPPPSPKLNAPATTNGTQFTRTGSHRRTGSSDFGLIPGSHQQQQPSVHPESESPKQPHRMKKKPAPLPPQGKGEEPSSAMFQPNQSSPELVRSKTPPTSNVVHGSSSSTMNPSAPSPAPRLHHTNSLRRPTAEPPKPPGSNMPPVKPPRPSPPVQTSQLTQSGDSQHEAKENKPPRPSPPKGEGGGSECPASLNAPIGFEKIEERKLMDDNLHIDTFASAQGPVGSLKGSSDKPGPIGFHVEGVNVREKIKETERNQDAVGSGDSSSKASHDVELRRHNGSVTDSEFRRSLEGVLKHQPPQGHSRHLVKPSIASEVPSVETPQEGKTPVQLPVFPVPAQRTSKEVTVEKPEPAPRSDKPALPEKPSVISRSTGTISGEHSRPVVIGTKPSSLSSSFTQGMTRSSERLEDVEQISSESFSHDKANAATEQDSVLTERPNKPPKPLFPKDRKMSLMAIKALSASGGNRAVPRIARNWSNLNNNNNKGKTAQSLRAVGQVGRGPTRRSSLILRQTAPRPNSIPRICEKGTHS